MPSGRLCALLLAVALPGTICAQTALVPPADLNVNFVGSWTGQLEYRDYASNDRVLLPTWLKITETPDHHSLVFSYLYDDGPTKVVRESVTLTLDPAHQTVTSVANDAKSPSGVTNTVYSATGFQEFAKTGRGALHLTGAATENGKPVDVRITLTLRRNLYTYRKETRPSSSNAEFQFRDGYVFTRSEPPAVP